jgi:hypothetical protein
VSRSDELQSTALALLERGRTLLAHGATPGLAGPAQMASADQVAALCAEALYRASGFGAVSSDTAFASPAALDVLVAELALSPAMADPLRHLRARVLALGACGAADPMDPFSAFQGLAVAEAVLGWTEARLAHQRCAGSTGTGSAPVYSA